MKLLRFALTTAFLLPVVFFVFVVFAPVPVNAADAHMVLAAAKQREESSDFSASGHLVRVDEKGTRVSEAVTIKAHWFMGGLRVLVDIESPDEAREHILLEMHPDGQNVIQIAHPGDTTPETLPFDKWSEGPLGADFNFEDFLEPQYFWPNQTVLEKTKFGARECDVVKSAPNSEDLTHYASIKTWLDHSIGFPVYVEKTVKLSGAVKEFTYFGLRQTDGFWSASQVEVKVRGKSGSTLLIVDRGTAKANLTLGDFSPERLIQF